AATDCCSQISGSSGRRITFQTFFKTVPTCPKCHKFISESHYQRHLQRCGTSHRHVTQSLYVPSATAQIESPNRGITYGSPRVRYTNRRRWRPWVIGAFVAIVLLAILFFFI
ncbi:MAG TPA: hypothetical protein VLU99_04505, partial [Nitrososphaerales archaeon]|nr:hypothetical protein [Nitrososphaerales archaeon]